MFVPCIYIMTYEIISLNSTSVEEPLHCMRHGSLLLNYSIWTKQKKLKKKNKEKRETW